MKKIIRHGYGRYHNICEHCTCHFTYELEDVDAEGHVTCPECDHVCEHSSFHPDHDSKLGEKYE